MNASDIMTSPAITVAPETRVHALAALLADRRLSAVPVVEDDRLVGIVGEGDMLHRHEIGTDRFGRPRPWWTNLFGPDDSSPAHYVQSHAVRVADLMQRDVATVGPSATLAEVVDVLERRHVRRLPVVEEGRVRGVVSRSDIVAALAAAGASPEVAESDASIRAHLLAELARQPWWRPKTSQVAVDRGIVIYDGIVRSEDERTAARVAAEAIPGVVGVDDRRIVIWELPLIV